MNVSTPLNALAHLIPAAMRFRRNKLPPGRCACHEPTVKWCGRHGEPLKAMKLKSA
jgi:hypothetical protein